MAIYLTNNQPYRTEQRRSNQQGINPLQALSMYQKFSGNGSEGTESWINSLFGGGSGGGVAAGEAGPGGASQLSPVTAGGGSGGGGAGGLGAGGIFAIIAAAIAAQHAASHNTDRVIEGHQVNDAFSGDFGTEPWFEWLGSELGWEPSAGAKFDAAVGNEDWSLAAKRLPAMTNYWADPARAWGNKLIREYAGDTVADIIDPGSWLVRKFEDWF